MTEEKVEGREIVAHLEDPEMANEVVAVLGPVLNGPAWGMMKELWEKQAAARRTAVVFQPLGDSVNAVYAQEYMKGEIAGIQIMVQLVEGVYKLALELKTEADQKVEKDNDVDDSTDSPE